jgi:hypothetical protein
VQAAADQRWAGKVAVVAAKALVAAAVIFVFVLPVLAVMPTWLMSLLAVALWIGATAAPWRRILRSDWMHGRQLRQASWGRLALAAAIIFGGAALCIASDYWFGTHATNDLGRQAIGAQWDLVLSTPFALLGLVILWLGMSAPGALVTAGALGYICVTSYESVTSSSSSTAAIGYVYPWLVGIPVVFTGYALDAAVRGAHGRRLWRHNARGR